METNICDKYIALLKANKNLILTGAPGTGKTYLAREIATAMGAEYEFVQFHPSYDYTDFVEGLRPTPPDGKGNIGFERKDGVFKEFCKRAIENIVNAFNEAGSNEVIHVIPSEHTEKQGISFDEVYDILVSDIKKNQAILYSDFRQKKTKLNVRASGEIIQGKEKIEFLKTNKYQNAQLDYIKKIYDYFVSKNCYDIRFENNDVFKKIIGNTLDYSYYRGIVQGLLDRTKHEYIDTLKTEHFNHPNVLPLTQTVQPQPIASSLPTNDTKKEISKPFVFIIDEINRGEISKIFGELFFSIDPGYRGDKVRVTTQYQNMITDKNDPFYHGFYVPKNVYIIGTMNDIDRSVESMDFAMRRRFAWKEIKTNENTGMLDSFGELKEEIVLKMNRLNNAIWNEETDEGIEGLSTAYHIGGAYFKKLELYLNDDESNLQEAFQQLWENHLRGVLFEYLRGSFNAADNLKKLEEIYYQEAYTNDRVERQ